MSFKIHMKSPLQSQELCFTFHLQLCLLRLQRRSDPQCQPLQTGITISNKTNPSSSRILLGLGRQLSIHSLADLDGVTGLATSTCLRTAMDVNCKLRAIPEPDDIAEP